MKNWFKGITLSQSKTVKKKESNKKKPSLSKHHNSKTKASLIKKGSGKSSKGTKS